MQQAQLKCAEFVTYRRLKQMVLMLVRPLVMVQVDKVMLCDVDNEKWSWCACAERFKHSISQFHHRLGSARKCAQTFAHILQLSRDLCRQHKTHQSTSADNICLHLSTKPLVTEMPSLTAFVASGPGGTSECGNLTADVSRRGS